MNRTRIQQGLIREQAAQVLQGLGVPEKDARIVADVLMDAEISGVESHGLTRLKPYADRLAGGLVEAIPDIQLTVNGAVATMDGGNGLGPVVMLRATETAISLARQYGIGAVTVSHSNHFGTAAYYVNRMAKEGCIGFAASMAGPTMAPFGGMDLMLGTNPFAVAFPGEDQIFCGDMATSATAKGKIRIYEKEGKKLPLGWALDQDGNDTTDPTAAIKGILLPMGGHKGYALAMAVDAVSALLSGACLSCESASVVSDQLSNTAHFALAVDIGHFLPETEFKSRAQAWFDQLKASRNRDGFQLMIPGEPEEKKRREAGETISVLNETLEMVESYYQKYASYSKIS